jgi:hypothetical protein
MLMQIVSRQLGGEIKVERYEMWGEFGTPLVCTTADRQRCVAKLKTAVGRPVVAALVAGGKLQRGPAPPLKPGLRLSGAFLLCAMPQMRRQLIGRAPLPPLRAFPNGRPVREHGCKALYRRGRGTS